MTRNFGNTFGRTDKGKERDYRALIKRLESPDIQPNPILPGPAQAPAPIILPPNEDIFFITDKKLYDEIKKYFAKEKIFSAHQDKFNKLTWDDANSVATGSSTYIATGVGMFCKTQMPQYELARQADLETDLQKFKSFYIDSGLALRSTDGINSTQAKHIYEQLKKREPKINFPVWLDLKGLELDANLNFNLTDKSRYKIAGCLNWDSGENYSQSDDFGLPSSKDKNSSRQIWTPNEKKGLRGCFLDRGSGLYSGSGGFAYSYSDGRVALVKARSA